MRFQRILEQVFHRAWMITPEAHSTVARLVNACILRSESDPDFSDFVNPRKAMTIQNGIANIDICGVLGCGLSPIEKSCGNTDYGDIENEVGTALKQGASAIVFHIDSPGGMASGCGECAQVIASCGVPTAANIGGQCNSAAYFLASGCAKIFAQPSSLVGSIGVIMARVDETGAWEKAGVKPDFITNTGGDLKSTGHGPSITDPQREYLQEMVDDLFAQFRDHVLSFRKIDSSAMRGQALVGPRALDANLIDGIGGTMKAFSQS